MGSTNYYVSQIVTTNGVACEGTRALIVVTVNSLPSEPTLSITAPTCSNSNGTVTVTNPTGEDYWYSNNDGQFQPGASFSIASNAAYSIKVKRLSTGCVSGAVGGTMGSSIQTPAAEVVIQTNPTCSSSTGTLKVVKAGPPTADYDNTIFEFSNDGINFGANPVFTFVAGAGYNITVRRKSDHTCTAIASCGVQARQATSSVPAQQDATIRLTTGSISNTKVAAFPNPFSDKVRFSMESAVSGQGALEIYNLMGQKVKTVYRGLIMAGKSQMIEYNVPPAQRTTLIYVFTVGGQKVSGKLIGLR